MAACASVSRRYADQRYCPCGARRPPPAARSSRPCRCPAGQNHQPAAMNRGSSRRPACGPNSAVCDRRSEPRTDRCSCADDVVVLVAVTVVAHRGFCPPTASMVCTPTLRLPGRLGCLGRYSSAASALASPVACRTSRPDVSRRYRDCPAQAAVIDRALYYRASRPSLAAAQDQRPRQSGKFTHRKRRVLGGRRHQQHHPVFHR